MTTLITIPFILEAPMETLAIALLAEVVTEDQRGRAEVRCRLT